jgi:transglutaminase-like putative cysteine protease
MHFFHHLSRLLFLVGLIGGFGLGLGRGYAAPDGDKVREFRFTYAATVTGLSAGQEAHLWLPVPPSNDEQQVQTIDKNLPATEIIGKEGVYNTQVLSLVARARDDGTIPLSITYRVKRREVRGGSQGQTVGKEERDLFLKPNARVPVDGKPLTLLQGKELPIEPMAKARALYDVVFNHMRYSKEGTGWGEGDAVWACDSKYGNCSDFHSLFMALARSQKIPVRFEMGFGLPEKRGQGDLSGYHCWVRFLADGMGWVPVDISEASKNPAKKDYFFGNLSEDRVAFSAGRDLTLVPKQEGPPLNMFIYPYVEVDGKPWPAEKVRKKFTFEDTER